eukprot:scaffold300209_cov25-Prasinocladus_malaysianus.AAC.1
MDAWMDGCMYGAIRQYSSSDIFFPILKWPEHSLYIGRRGIALWVLLVDVLQPYMAPMKPRSWHQ